MDDGTVRVFDAFRGQHSSCANVQGHQVEYSDRNAFPISIEVQEGVTGFQSSLETFVEVTAL
jgi:hypothetical protein